MSGATEDQIEAPTPRWRRRLLGGAILSAGLIAGAYRLACAPEPMGLPRGAPAGLGRGADPRALEAHVRALASTIGHRSLGDRDNLAMAAGYVAAVFAREGLTPERQRLPSGFDNVLARVGPRGGPQLVVGAHYDTAHDTPGADDNASGVAALLEVARLLAQSPPTCGVELVAYALEEPPSFRTPAMGSAVHAAGLRTEGAELRAMLALEMLGAYSDAPNSQHFPNAYVAARYPSTASFLAVVGRTADRALAEAVRDAASLSPKLPVFAFTAPASFPGIDFSDHLNYWAQGYPAVMLTDTAFLRNPRYHRPSDTPDTLDYERLSLAANGAYAAVLALCSD